MTAQEKCFNVCLPRIIITCIIYSPTSYNFYKEVGAMNTSYNITKRRQSCSFVQWVFGDT